MPYLPPHLLHACSSCLISEAKDGRMSMASVSLRCEHIHVDVLSRDVNYGFVHRDIPKFPRGSAILNASRASMPDRKWVKVMELVSYRNPESVSRRVRGIPV